MTKALYLTVLAELSNATDGQTDRIDITIGDLGLRADALASVDKNGYYDQIQGRQRGPGPIQVPCECDYARRKLELW